MPCLSPVPVAQPHPLPILGGDLQGGWAGYNPEDSHVRTLPLLMWKGAETYIFTPPHQPGMATYIDNLSIWDPRHLSDQIGDTITLATSFLYHKGVLGIIHLPVFTEEATAPPLARPPRVPTLMFPVPEHAMENMALQSSGRFIRRYRPLIGHCTLTIRLHVI
jgi:hypothetical protein